MVRYSLYTDTATVRTSPCMGTHGVSAPDLHRLSCIKLMTSDPALAPTACCDLATSVLQVAHGFPEECGAMSQCLSCMRNVENPGSGRLPPK